MASWWFQPILKNISQIGSFPQVGVKIENIWNHQDGISMYIYLHFYGKFVGQYYQPHGSYGF